MKLPKYMTQKDKDLLLRDLCARLPYGVKVRRFVYTTPTDAIESVELFNPYWLNELYSEKAEFKPYLRSMDDMTEEEKNEHFGRTMTIDIVQTSKEVIDWLNTHHFDYRGLIPIGLALEAPKDMYEIKEK